MESMFLIHSFWGWVLWFSLVALSIRLIFEWLEAYGFRTMAEPASIAVCPTAHVVANLSPASIFSEICQWKTFCDLFEGWATSFLVLCVIVFKFFFRPFTVLNSLDPLLGGFPASYSLIVLSTILSATVDATAWWSVGIIVRVIAAFASFISAIFMTLYNRFLLRRDNLHDREAYATLWYQIHRISETYDPYFYPPGVPGTPGAIQQVNVNSIGQNHNSSDATEKLHYAMPTSRTGRVDGPAVQPQGSVQDAVDGSTGSPTCPSSPPRAPIPVSRTPSPPSRDEGGPARRTRSHTPALEAPEDDSLPRNRSRRRGTTPLSSEEENSGLRKQPRSTAAKRAKLEAKRVVSDGKPKDVACPENSPRTENEAKLLQQLHPSDTSHQQFLPSSRDGGETSSKVHVDTNEPSSEKSRYSLSSIRCDLRAFLVWLLRLIATIVYPKKKTKLLAPGLPEAAARAKRVDREEAVHSIDYTRQYYSYDLYTRTFSYRYMYLCSWIEETYCLIGILLFTGRCLLTQLCLEKP
eukprot:Rmarinus@m.28018